MKQIEQFLKLAGFISSEQLSNETPMSKNVNVQD